MRKDRREQVEGPLAPFALGIEEMLLAGGYLEKSVGVLMRLMAELSRWLGRRRLGPVTRARGWWTSSSRRAAASLPAEVAALAEVGPGTPMLLGGPHLRGCCPTGQDAGRGRAAWRLQGLVRRATGLTRTTTDRYCCSPTPGTRPAITPPSSTSLTSTPSSSAASWTTSSASGATAPPPKTPDWLLSTRSSLRLLPSPRARPVHLPGAGHPSEKGREGASLLPH